MRVATPVRAKQRPVRPAPFLIGAGVVACAVLLLAQRAVVALPLAATSPLVPLARLFDLVLTGGVLLLAHAAGARVLRALGLLTAPVEGVAFATALGLGLGAYCALTLGFVGLYRAPILLGGLVVAAVVLRREIFRSATGLSGGVGRLVRVGADAAWGVPAIVILLGFAGFAVVLGALAPPHHWDPLAYHLSVPQYFLQTGRIAPIQGIELSNTPLTIELLYGVGLAAGSATFGALLHGACAVIAGLGAWGLARRYADRTTAWLTLALFCSTPLVLVWSRVANNDLALAVFVLLAVAAALRAGPAPKGEVVATEPAVAGRWLALAGIFAGLALGSKYQALYAVAPLGLAILLDSWGTQARGTGRFWRAGGTALKHAAIFGALTALVAAPWYIKNWLWLDNPIWPTVFGGRDFSPLAADITSDFLRDRVLSPRTLVGYALLPLRAYTTGDFEQRLVILNPFFLICPALILLRRLWRREVWYALVVSAGFIGGFTMGVQELRYLLVVCPLLSLLAAYVLRAGWERAWLRRPIMGGLIGAALLALVLVGLHVGADRPIGVLLGRESRDEYLRQNVAYGASHRAISYLMAQLRPGDRALFMHEAQVFYLPPELIASNTIRPDHLNLQLLLLTETYPEPQEMLRALQAEGIDYLLVNEANIRSWEQSDPRGRLARGKAALDRFTPLLEPLYRDGPPDRPSLVLYRIPAAPASR